MCWVSRWTSRVPEADVNGFFSPLLKPVEQASVHALPAPSSLYDQHWPHESSRRALWVEARKETGRRKDRFKIRDPLADAR